MNKKKCMKINQIKPISPSRSTSWACPLCFQCVSTFRFSSGSTVLFSCTIISPNHVRSPPVCHMSHPLSCFLFAEQILVSIWVRSRVYTGVEMSVSQGQPRLSDLVAKLDREVQDCSDMCRGGIADILDKGC